MIKLIKTIYPFFILTLSVVLLIGTPWYLIYKEEKKYSVTKYYNGPIIEKGYDEPSSGYKTHTDAVYYVIILDIESQSYVRVHTVVSTYYKFNKGDTISFNLTLRNMIDYGNGAHKK